MFLGRGLGALGVLFAVGGLFFALAANGQSVSAQEALNEVSVSPAFLNAGESPEVFSESPVFFKSGSFWLIAVVSGSSVVGMVPFSASAPLVIPVDAEARRELVRAGYFLRQVSLVRSNAEASGQWLFSSVESKFFSDLASELSQQAISLSAVEAELSAFSDLKNKASALVLRANDLRQSALAVSKAISQASGATSSFFSSPKTSELEKMKRSWIDALDAVVAFDADALAYSAKVNELGIGIAGSKLPLESKRSLQSLLALPPRLAGVSVRANAALLLKESIEKEWDNRLSRSASLLSDLSLRIERSKANGLLYGSDAEIVDASNGSLSSLSQLSSFILRDESRDRWKEQSALSRAQEDFQKASAHYAAGRFDAVVGAAANAKKNALLVYKAGFAPEVVEDPSVDWSNWISWAAIGLVGLAVLFFLLKNAGKLKGAVVSAPPKGEWEELAHDLER